jgi:hypothetical protein
VRITLLNSEQDVGDFVHGGRNLSGGPKPRPGGLSRRLILAEHNHSVPRGTNKNPVGLAGRTGFIFVSVARPCKERTGWLSRALRSPPTEKRSKRGCQFAANSSWRTDDLSSPACSTWLILSQVDSPQ